MASLDISSRSGTSPVNRQRAPIIFCAVKEMQMTLLLGAGRRRWPCRFIRSTAITEAASRSCRCILIVAEAARRRKVCDTSRQSSPLLPRDAMQSYNALLLWQVVCPSTRPSVRLSVTLKYCGCMVWVSSKIVTGGH